MSDEMIKYKWEELIGKRLLLTDRITRIQRNEWTLLELNSNGRIGKFRNELVNTRFWTDLDDLVVMDVLPHTNKEDTNEPWSAENADSRARYIKHTLNGVVVSKGKAVPPKFELGEDDE